MTPPAVSEQTLADTRRVLHTLAEHLLAPAARAATGSVRLRMIEGALSTPEIDPFGTRIALGERGMIRAPRGPWLPFAGTFAGLAEQLGIGFGLLDPPYPPATPARPDAPVDVDPSAAALILEAWRTGAEALRRFDQAADAVVWPEHLDVAITREDVNYGVSPGDGYQPWPYAYVGPHEPRQGPFWNAPFGAARRLSDLGGAPAVARFFSQGRSEAR